MAIVEYAITTLNRFKQAARILANIGDTIFTGSGLDDCTLGGAFTGVDEKKYRIQIDGAGTPDTFKWSDTGGAAWNATGVNVIAATAINLNRGVTVTFVASTGHTLNDRWDMTSNVDESDDDWLEFLINAGTAFIERYCGRILKKRSSAITKYHDGSGNYYLVPDEWPIESKADIVSIHDDIYREYGEAHLIDPDDYFVVDQNEIRLSEWSSQGCFQQGIQNVKLVYAPGYTTVPYELEMGALMVLVDIYQKITKGKQGATSITIGDVTVALKDYTIPPAAKMMLDSYKRKG